MGIVFDIQRCSYHDGPGVRTTVFLKGCALRCAWCHNPESFSGKPQLRYLKHKCIGCGACSEVCRHGVHSFTDAHTVNFSSCIACGECTSACPEDALSIVGREMSVAEVMQIVSRDRSFYEATGGGVTISGGEPTFQSAFLLELAKSLKAAGISAALETNGYIPPKVLQQILPYFDLFLLDFKLTAQEGLKPYTNAEGNFWDNTVETLCAWEKPVILRLPIVPGINDTKEHFEKAVAYKCSHSNILSLEIMPYHSIGKDKWDQLGLKYTLSHIPNVEPPQAEAWKAMLKSLEEAASSH